MVCVVTLLLFNGKLIFITLIIQLGLYWCTDNPGALHDDFEEKFKGLYDDFEFRFNLLYSLYSLPNVVLPLITGVLMIKFGARIVYLFLSFIVVFGQIIFSLGSFQSSFNLMILGRMVFGIGAESLNITQYTMIYKWFHKNELAMPIGLTCSIAGLGRVLNDIISPIIVSVFFY